MLFNVADLKCPNDPQGRTYRQVYAAMKHTIPIGALVEINADGDGKFDGVRLYVVGHSRDCDQTPLYQLSYDRSVIEWEPYPGYRKCGLFSGDSLTVIKPPANDNRKDG